MIIDTFKRGGGEKNTFGPEKPGMHLHCGVSDKPALDESSGMYTAMSVLGEKILLS
jgi:hypothetical protein